MPHSPLLLFVLGACAGGGSSSKDHAEAECDLAWYADADHDGFGSGEPTLACDAPSGSSALAGDCDDGDPGVYPGAPETCDGVDQDCDDQVDEDAIDSREWYTDADGDGFRVGEAVSACTAPAGSAATPGDCDDTNATVYPGAVEIWYDGVDSNCDDADDYDADGDGYPAGGPDGTDCDDADPAVYPSAEEICDDGLDNDCDGIQAWCKLEGELNAADAPAVLNGPHYASYAGKSVDVAPGFLPGDEPVILVGVPMDDTAGTDAGAVVVWTEAPSGEQDLADAPTVLTGAAPLDLAGMAVSGVGDTNGDGYADVLVGSPSGSTESTGQAYLLLGPSTGGLGLAAAQWTGVGEAHNDNAGSTLCDAGDLNDDGYADWLIGAPAGDVNGNSSGSAYIILGPSSGTHSLSSAHARILGTEADDQLSDALTGLGDINGDGVDDFAITSRGSPVDEFYGVVWIFTHLPTGDAATTDADATVWGTHTSDKFGSAVAAAGDHDGDGYADLLVGAPGVSTTSRSAGAAYLVTGPLVGHHTMNESTAKMLGTEVGESAGLAVDCAGDVDHDDHLDILVAAPDWQEQTGRVMLLYGPVTGTMSLSSADAVFSGGQRYDGLGQAVRGAGDINADGFDDILIGAPSAPGKAYRGAVYVWYGSDIDPR